MHKIRALCLLIRTETLQKATAGRGRRRLQQEGGVNGYVHYRVAVLDL